MQWRLIHKYGKTYLEGKYDNETWHDWLFRVDTEPHKYWVYMPAFNVYRSNVSI